MKSPEEVQAKGDKRTHEGYYSFHYSFAHVVWQVGILYMLWWGGEEEGTVHNIPSSLLHKLFYEPLWTHPSANFVSTTDRKA